MRYDNCLLHIEPEGNPFAGVAVGLGAESQLLMTILPHRPIDVSSGSPEDDWEIALVDLDPHEFEITTPTDDGAPRQLIPLFGHGLPGRPLARSRTNEESRTPFAWPALAVTPGTSPNPGVGISFASFEQGCSLWISHGTFVAQIVLKPKE